MPCKYSQFPETYTTEKSHKKELNYLFSRVEIQKTTVIEDT